MQKSERATVITAFDQDGWNRVGIAWLSSLLELAKFKGEVCVVNDELNKRTVAFLEEHKVRLVPVKKQFKETSLNHFCSAVLAAGDGVSAYWDSTSFFQANLDDLIQMASDKVVVALGQPPQPMIRNSLEAFGFSDTDSESTAALHKMLLNIARTHGTVIQGRFIAGQKDHLTYLGKFVEFHVKHGYIRESKHAVDLLVNLFYSSNSKIFKVDSRWSDLIDSHWVWRSGFYKGNDLVKVVSFPPDIVYSAICARFHYVNCYRSIHATWQAKHQSKLAIPRLLLKNIQPAKERENDQKVQVRPGS